MKLNADIIYAALDERYTVKILGPKTTQLTFSRPELLLGSEVELQSDHLYLASVDHLPLHLKLQKNVVIVVIGDGARLAYYRERCCLIIIHDQVDFFAVNEVLSQIFDRYYEWEKQLFDIFLGFADLQEIVDCSVPIFQRPIHLLDSSFHFLVHSVGSNSPFKGEASADDLPPEMLSEYLSSFELLTETHGAIVISLDNGTALCVNLYDGDGQYIGCAYIEEDDRPFTESDKALAEFMGHLMEKAIEKNPAILTNEQNTIKNALANLVCEYPLTVSQKWMLNLSNHSHRYVCIGLHSASQLSWLPKGYISNAFESAFPDAYAFSHEDAIICFLNVDSLADKKGGYTASLNRTLAKFLKETRSIAGISNSFTELYHARIGFLQAESAIENGMITNPSSDLFYFQSYALVGMVINALGNLQAEAYFPDNLKNMIEHDERAAVSYLETLREFLRNSMSYSQTAESLCIHRSTAVDRIARIERELGVNLKDPEVRLQLEIILKAMEIEKMMQQARD